MFIHFLFFLLMLHLPPRSTLFPYTTLFRSQITLGRDQIRSACPHRGSPPLPEDSAVNTLFRHKSSPRGRRDRKSTRLNSSHTVISYAVFCLKKKKKKNAQLNYTSNTNTNTL